MLSHPKTQKYVQVHQSQRPDKTIDNSPAKKWYHACCRKNQWCNVNFVDLPCRSIQQTWPHSPAVASQGFGSSGLEFVWIFRIFGKTGRAGYVIYQTWMLIWLFTFLRAFQFGCFWVTGLWQWDHYLLFDVSFIWVHSPVFLENRMWFKRLIFCTFVWSNRLGQQEAFGCCGYGLCWEKVHDSLCKKQTSMSAMAIFAALREDMYIVYFNVFENHLTSCPWKASENPVLFSGLADPANLSWTNMLGSGLPISMLLFPKKLIA